VGVGFEKFLQRFIAEERGEIETHAQALIAEERSLREPRQALGETQARQWNDQASKQESVFLTEEEGRTIESTE